MLDVEVFGAELIRDAPPFAEMHRLCVAAAASAGIADGHVAIEFVDAERIALLNGEHRGKPAVTDVLSFPIDGAGTPSGGEFSAGARERIEAAGGTCKLVELKRARRPPGGTDGYIVLGRID